VSYDRVDSESVDELLDEALAETIPANESVAISTSRLDAALLLPPQPIRNGD